MIGSNDALYTKVEELSQILDRAGEGALASGLRDALAAGSLPGEILGETRIALRRVRTSPLYQRLDVRSRVDEGIRYVDSVLGG
jgi:hypothetical protein